MATKDWSKQRAARRQRCGGLDVEFLTVENRIDTFPETAIVWKSSHSGHRLSSSELRFVPSAFILRLVRNYLNIEEVSSTWSNVRSFALVIFFPVVVLSAIAVGWFDSSMAVQFKSQFGSPLHLWARATTDVAKAGPYFSATFGLWLLFLGLRRWGSKIASADFFRAWQNWAAFAFVSFLLSGILVQVAKHIIGRRRPYADEMLSSYQFHPFSANYEHHSLPSGHSQVLFTAAAVLMVAFPKFRWLWLILAAIFASTRAITLNHWISDVIAGAGMGLMGTVLALRMLNLRQSRLESQGSKNGSFLKSFAAFVVGGLLLVATFSTSVARADGPGPFGVGIIVGDPTGLSGNYRLSSLRSIDAALAWSFGNNPGFEIHSDYLWRRPGLFRAETVKFDLHYGVGARLLSLSNSNVSDKTRFGPRLPVGLGTNFNQQALEVFAEVALVMNIIPATSADLDFGVGARVYF